MPKTPSTLPAREWMYSNSQGVEGSVWVGDIRQAAIKVPPRRVQTVITSPPYWGLRDYATARWVGGDATCTHDQRRREGDNSKQASNAGSSRDSLAGRRHCRLCGAQRIDTQIGNEPQLDCNGWATGNRCGECYVCHIVEVSQLVKRILRNDGIFWLNIGDNISWAGGGHLDSGNLCGTPWRVALAMQADGWLLRAAMTWVKSNAMPESCDDRPGKATEDIFMFVKQSDYYFDMEAVRKDAVRPGDVQTFGKRDNPQGSFAPDDPMYRGGTEQWGRTVQTSAKRNWRMSDLWYSSVDGTGLVGVGEQLIAVNTPIANFRGAHFATMPPKLVVPLVLASTSAAGCCAECFAPLVRILSEEQVEASTTVEGRDRSIRSNRNGMSSKLEHRGGFLRETLGWKAQCKCGAPSIPCTVFDPFLGSGTTAVTSIELGRSGMGVELNKEYADTYAIPRIQGALDAEKGAASESALDEWQPPEPPVY